MTPVRSLTLREIRLPLREPFRISSGTVTERRIVLLELEDTEGRRTWSECVAMERPNYFPDTVDTCWLAIRKWIAPRVLGRNFAGPEEAHRALAADIRGHQMAKAAVEMGLWALEAEAREVSLATLLGGTRGTVETGISLGIQASPEALVERVERALEEGYPRIKVKIKPGFDLEYLRAVREAVGEGVALMADANSAYRLDDGEHLARMNAFRLTMLEQPLAWDDLLEHARLQQQIATPICLDESITGPERVRDMLALGAGRIVNIKPGRVGGLAPAKAIHDLCSDKNVDVWCGGMLESGVGRAYNVALASLPGFTLPGDLSPSARYWERDIVSPEWTMDARGRVTVPRGAPGLGVEVDRDRIERLTVRREVLAAA